MKNGARSDPIFSITLGGHDFTFSAYNAHKLCVRTLEKVPDHFLIGDVFFRQHLVVHDMRNLLSPAVGIATRNPKYAPIRAKLETVDILLQMPPATDDNEGEGDATAAAKNVRVTDEDDAEYDEDEVAPESIGDTDQGELDLGLLGGKAASGSVQDVDALAGVKENPAESIKTTQPKVNPP